MFTLPQNNKKLKVQSMGQMMDAGLLDIFNATLKESKDRELEELVATITVSLVQTSVALAQRVAEGGTPSFLVRCLDRPTAQTQHVCMSIWFYVTGTVWLATSKVHTHSDTNCTQTITRTRRSSLARACWTFWAATGTDRAPRTTR